jgi:hypothetical protein
MVAVLSHLITQAAVTQSAESGAGQEVIGPVVLAVVACDRPALGGQSAGPRTHEGCRAAFEGTVRLVRSDDAEFVACWILQDTRRPLTCLGA